MFTKDNAPLDAVVTGDILTSDQIDQVTDVTGFLFGQAEEQFGFEFNGEDVQAIIDDTIAKKDAGIPLQQATLSLLRLLQAAVDSQKLKDALQYAIDALADNGKIDLFEGVLGGVKIAGGIKDEKKN